MFQILRKKIKENKMNSAELNGEDISRYGRQLILEDFGPACNEIF